MLLLLQFAHQSVHVLLQLFVRANIKITADVNNSQTFQSSAITMKHIASVKLHSIVTARGAQQTCYFNITNSMYMGTYDSDDAKLASAFSSDSSVVNNFLDTCNIKQTNVNYVVCTDYADLLTVIKFPDLQNHQLFSIFGTKLLQ